jgi:serine palmitoyltransferase
LRYKFRLILDETWSFGVLGRTGRGVADSQSIDPTQVDMIIGSLSGPLSAAGGFCAGTHDVVQHQRVTSTAYTYSCAMPAILTTTARETISLIEANPEILTTSRENTAVMRAQIAKCDWVYSTSVPENPMQLLVLKPDIIKGHDLSIAKQEQILQECVGEVCGP